MARCSGALRIDSGTESEAGRFMRLALPGDVIGVEQWVGTDDRLGFKALTEVCLEPGGGQRPGDDADPDGNGGGGTPALPRGGHAAHRAGVAARQTLLLMFADTVSPEATRGSDIALPNLSDMADILDAAPETVSRVFSSMRQLDFLQDRKPHRARFSSLSLRAQALVPGMTVSSALQRSQLVGR